MQERLGHSTIAVTLDIYSHAVPSLGREAADRLHDVLHEDDGAVGDGQQGEARDEGETAAE